jgi:hypothetical protein
MLTTVISSIRPFVLPAIAGLAAGVPLGFVADRLYLRREAAKAAGAPPAAPSAEVPQQA